MTETRPSVYNRYAVSKSAVFKLRLKVLNSSAERQLCDSDRAVRRRRRATAADILLTPPPPIVTDRRAAAVADDRMSASRGRRFRDVFTLCCTPAICC